MTMDEVLFRSEFDRDGDYVFVEPLTNDEDDAAPNPEIPRRVSGVAFSPEVMRALAKLSTVVGSTPLHITSPEFPNVRVVVKGIPASVAVEVHA
jgi:hypothetical protein